jgi:hypothetical protein
MDEAPLARRYSGSVYERDGRPGHTRTLIRAGAPRHAYNHGFRQARVSSTVAGTFPVSLTAGVQASFVTCICGV